MTLLLTPTTISLIAVLVSAAALIASTLISVLTARSNARRSDAQMLYATRIAAYDSYPDALHHITRITADVAWDRHEGNDLIPDSVIVGFNTYNEQGLRAVLRMRLFDHDLGSLASHHLSVIAEAFSDALTVAHPTTTAGLPLMDAHDALLPRFKRSLVGRKA